MTRLALLLLLVLALPARAERALVAVAANFLAPAEVLAQAFQEETGHEIALASGATGQHYAQILHGAPYDLFLSADAERPALLHDLGLGAAPAPYALGRLALVASDPDFPVAEGPEALRAARFVAIANPALAPYGRAAQEVLEGAGLWQDLEGRIVQGQNVGQAFGMVLSGNAQAGLVALSQARGGALVYWEVPFDLHGPIRQDAILLARAQGNLAAQEFLAYLASEPAAKVLQEFGYERP